MDVHLFNWQLPMETKLMVHLVTLTTKPPERNDTALFYSIQLIVVYARVLQQLL